MVLEHGCEASIGTSEGSMSRSNIEEMTSEQTRGRETGPTTRGEDKKEKSCDAINNMKARLAKMELVIANTKEGMDLFKQAWRRAMRIYGSKCKTFMRECLSHKFNQCHTRGLCSSKIRS